MGLSCTVAAMHQEHHCVICTGIHEMRQNVDISSESKAASMNPEINFGVHAGDVQHQQSASIHTLWDTWSVVKRRLCSNEVPIIRVPLSNRSLRLSGLTLDYFRLFLEWAARTEASFHILTRHMKPLGYQCVVPKCNAKGSRHNFIRCRKIRVC